MISFNLSIIYYILIIFIRIQLLLFHFIFIIQLNIELLSVRTYIITKCKVRFNKFFILKESRNNYK